VRSIVVHARPPKQSSVLERRWSLGDVVKFARSLGADVFRYGQGFRFEFSDNEDAEEFVDKVTIGGFRFAETE
jgi:hypothetical protein